MFLHPKQNIWFDTLFSKFINIFPSAPSVLWKGTRISQDLSLKSSTSLLQTTMGWIQCCHCMCGSVFTCATCLPLPLLYPASLCAPRKSAPECLQPSSRLRILGGSSGKERMGKSSYKSGSLTCTTIISATTLWFHQALINKLIIQQQWRYQCVLDVWVMTT